MSVLKKQWVIKNTDRKQSLLKKLLANRGLESEVEMEQFFHPTAERDFHDPFLMKDMGKAVLRIGQAIEKGERIMIFGDYDVDGVTGSAILMRALRLFKANVSYRLPHRIEDGYGLREKFIKEFAKLDVKLAITVDNGISCFNEVALANELGIDVIISDHHTVPEKIPAAYAILHPKLPGCGYPFTELTGAGVALKLAQALFERRLDSVEAREQATTGLLDLACMGTIADFGALTGENRYIVKEGLRMLENTRWPGLSRLKDNAGCKGKISTYDIGFLLGPRINAAGRISHSSHALRLLLADDDSTHVLADTLEKLNRKRQKMMEELNELADTMATEQLQNPIIILHHPEFHGGIIGLIAAKMVEKYSRPAIAMEERAESLIGSCRTTASVNIIEALSSAKDLLSHFGGHAGAAGFDLPKKNLQAFKERLMLTVGKATNAESCLPKLAIECEISHEEVSQQSMEMLRWFEPFGAGNDAPRFLLSGVPLHDYRTVGADKKHLKLTTRLNGEKVDAIGFKLGSFVSQLNGSKTLDLVCEIDENEWQGKKSVQLKIADFRVAE
ncbi:MAG: single-stranded-DNA-specific exonuclease RecJ [Patescibacteria group bacterium]